MKAVREVMLTERQQEQQRLQQLAQQNVQTERNLATTIRHW